MSRPFEVGRLPFARLGGEDQGQECVLRRRAVQIAQARSSAGLRRIARARCPEETIFSNIVGKAIAPPPALG
jgi:hypothetical protein